MASSTSGTRATALENEDFRRAALLPGGDLQTIGGQFARSSLTWIRPTEDFHIEVEPEVNVLIRASWQPDRDSSPALILIHGLEGCDRSPYMLSTGELAYRTGFSVLRMNMRGCGDSLRICPRLYNAGLAADLVAVARWLSEKVRRFVVCGFSLSANLALLALARHDDELPAALAGAAAVSPPVDLSACADTVAKPRNWIYEYHFVRQLRLAYRSRQLLAPELYIRGRERGLDSLRAYDDVITAHYAGFRDAEDYYRKSSAGPHLTSVRRPTLMLAAENDPLIPSESVSKWPISRMVHREMIPSGGHVGFVGRSNAPGRFWAADRVVHFLQKVIDPSNP